MIYLNDQKGFMKKIIMSVSLLALTAVATQTQAGTSSIDRLFDHDYGKGYYNCSYKGKVASKKCLVTRSLVKATIDPRTKSFYGANYNVPLLTIKWPDNDTSRYIFMDSWDMINIADRKNYNIDSVELNGEILILYNGKDHVRLW